MPRFRPGAERWFLQAVLRAYSARRGGRSDPAFAAVSVADHVPGDLPPMLVVLGNAGSLRRHPRVLADRLAVVGVATATMLGDEDHEPALGHECQFGLDTNDAPAFLTRSPAFLSGHLARGEWPDLPRVTGTPGIAGDDGRVGMITDGAIAARSDPAIASANPVRGSGAGGAGIGADRA